MYVLIKTDRNKNVTDLVYCEPAMSSIVERARLASAFNETVLIKGETGTGKELLARFIHQQSSRSEGPFVGLNCAAIPPGLLESELFGHERGAFSGAIERHVGKVELAQNGTLLLDEISELDINLQAKLLRVIQEREMDRVGGSGSIRTNARFVLTTNCDLWEQVRRGRFRSDLFFRISVIPIVLPSLRERPQDIGVLSEHFLSKFQTSYDCQPSRSLSISAKRRLMSYHWPGNVRELENTIYRTLALCSDPVIAGSSLELTLPVNGGESEARLPLERKQTNLKSLNATAKDTILDTLVYTNGNRTKAAVILGLSPKTLRNKLRIYAISSARTPSECG